MKRLLLLFSILLLFAKAYSQDISPLPSATVKKLISPNTPVFYYNTADSALWVFKGETGWLRIATNEQLKKYYVPYIGANKDVDLGIHRILAKGQLIPLFNGACVVPTIADNGDGSITVGNGEYHLSTRTDGKGTNNYSISGGIFSLTDNTTNYLVADYNSGTPILKVITDVNLINETTVVPIYTAYRSGTVLHFQNWDALGVALANKVHQSIVKTQRYRRESGLGISEVATRYLSVGSGRVWVGAVPVDIAAIITSTDNLRFYYHSGGVWTLSVQPQYNNTQYDNGVNLVELTANRYAVNWLYRGIESQKHLYVIAGTGDYTLTQAQEAIEPAKPTIISSHAALIGKLIVQKGATSATSIQSAFDTQFTSSTPSAHNDLTGRDVPDVHPAGSITFSPTGTYTATTVAEGLKQIDEKTPDRSITNEIQAPTRIGDLIGSTQTTTTISIADKLPTANVSGTSGYVSKFTGANSLGNSPIYTDGTNVGINVIPTYRFELSGIATNYNTSPSIVLSDITGLADSRRWLIGNVATDYGSLNIAVSNTNSDAPNNPKLTILKEGNVGIGFISGTEISNNKLSVNGDGYYSGILNLYKPLGDIYIKTTSGSSYGLFGTDANAAFISSNGNLMWYAENAKNNFYQPVRITGLSGSGTRFTTASSDGTLGTLANGIGYLQNDGSGNISWNFPEITSLRSTGSTFGQVATSNGAGGIEMRNPVLSVTTFVKEKSPTGIFNLAHSSIVYNNQLFVGERAANPKIIRFSNLDNLGTYSSTTITGSGFSGQGLEYGYYVSSIGKVCFSVRNQTAGLDIIELNPADMTWTRHNFSTISGSFHVSATDGTYIYVANLSYIKKIRVSDWTEIASVGLPSNIQFPHAMEVNVARGEAYLTGSIADPIYMAKINTADLSYTQINLSDYISKATDDLCFYDDGTTNKVFIGGETFANTQQYCGVVVETTNGDALSQIHIKPSYGLFIDGVKVFNCSLDGYIQTFSALDPTNVSTFLLEGFAPNEVLPVSSSGRTFFTHWNTTASVMAEFYVPLPTPIQSGLTNPMTTTGDMIYSVGSTPTRLGIGSSSQILTVVGGVPSWQNAAAGFTDPMTTRGDMIYRNSSNVTARLPLGTNGQLLGSNGSDVVWVNAPSGTSQWTNDTNGITYAGNIGVGVASAVGTRIYAEQAVNGGYTAKIRNTSSTGLGMFLETSGTTSSHPILLAQTTAINDVFRVNADGSIKMSLLPNVDQSYVLGYNPSTGAVTYLTKPSGSGGSGTVTSFSSGNLSPLFTTSVSNATTTPALSFSAVSQAANTVYASPNGTSGVPTFRKIVVGDISATGTPSSSTALFGDGSWKTVGGTNYWQAGTGYIAPATITDEVRIGSTSDVGEYILQVAGASSFTSASAAYSGVVSYNTAGGTAISGTSSSGGLAGTFTTNPSSTGLVEPILSLRRTTSGTASNGIGGSVEFYLESQEGVSTSGSIINRYTSVTTDAQSSSFEFQLQNAGAVLATKTTILGNGNLITTGSVDVGDDSTAASSANVGAIRYRTSGNNSYCEMVMQTGASTYSWVIIKQNNW